MLNFDTFLLHLHLFMLQKFARRVAAYTLTQNTYLHNVLFLFEAVYVTAKSSHQKYFSKHGLVT